MKFANGRRKPEGSGRQKGIPNKVTKNFRDAVTKLIEDKQDHFIEWLEAIPNPKDRFDVICKLADFVYPKISRVEHSGSIGEPLLGFDVTPYERRQLLIQLKSKLNEKPRLI